MRARASIGLLLLALSGASGCRSAHISDSYIARDDEGRRRTNCLRPEYNHYFVFVEMYSFKDDTIMTPVLRNLSSGGIEPLAYEDDELAEFGNVAPGKSQDKFILKWEVLGPLEDPGNPSNTNRLPLIEGAFQWEFYLDDHSSADAKEAVTVSPGCG